MRIIIPLRIFLLCLINFFIVSGSIAQFYPVRRYTVEDGLAHSNVFRIFQDKKGFIWLGTEYGVSCFDGKKINNYTSSAGLSFNTVMSISESPAGEKWVCTYGGGINIIANDSIYPAITGQKISRTVMYSLYSLFNKNKVWIVDKTGLLYCLSGTTMRQVMVPDDDGNPVFFRKMIQTADDQILFLTNKGIYKSNDEKIEPYLEKLINERVYALQEGKDGALWCALKNRVVVVSNNTITQDIFCGNYADVSDMLVDKNGSVWLAVPGEGILHINKETVRNITAYLKLQNILINDLFEDREGNIWVATHGSGLFFIHSLSIINYPVEFEKINNYSKAIKNINGKIYTGSVGTVSINEKEKFVSYPLNLLQSYDFVYFIEEWNERLYIGTPRGLLIKNLTGDKKEMLLPASGAISYYRDNYNRQWIGCFGELAYLEGNILKFITHPIFSFRRVNSINADSMGNILFATDSGLVTYNGKEFRHQNISSNTWSNSINCIYTDQAGFVWLGTDWGTCRMKNGEQRWYYKKDGLSHNKCNVIAEDKTGNIWMGTMGGLDKFNGSYFRTFNHKSGLTSNEVLSLNTDTDGSIWAGTVNGISRILKEEAEKNITVPQVYITGAVTSASKYRFPQEIILQPDEKELHIDFTAINFSYGDNVEYSYRISNRGDAWHTTSDNSLTISSLAPGSYQFMLKAGIAGRPACEEISVLHIRVLAPFWKKTWFIVLCGLVVAAFFYLIVRWFIIRREKIKYEKASLHHKIAYLKQQALTALINPHFIFNCLNSIQSYIYKNNTQLANQYLVKFSRLIRMTLDKAEHTYINLEEEIARLNLYLSLEQLRFADKLRYTITCPPEIATREIKIPNMILQPYIENAIRHGIRPRKEGGNVNISFSWAGERLLLITIDDDGVGISKSRREEAEDAHRPLGMKLTGERLNLLSQLNRKTFEASVAEKKDGQGNVRGTTVTISVAVDFEHDTVPMEAE